MTVTAVPTPSMKSSNSMSSGYCSQEDDSEDLTYFTAKTSFFPKARRAAKVQIQALSGTGHIVEGRRVELALGVSFIWI